MALPPGSSRIYWASVDEAVYYSPQKQPYLTQWLPLKFAYMRERSVRRDSMPR